MTKEQLSDICYKLENMQINTGEISAKRALFVARKVLDLVGKFADNHSDLAMECGSEWLFQSDDGLIDAPQLVGEILDFLIECEG